MTDARAAWQPAARRVVYPCLAAVVFVLAVIGRLVDPSLFRQLIGGMDPALAAAGIGLLGGVLLRLPLARRGFVTVRPEPWAGLSRAVGIALLFGAIVIGADLVLVHPADMNVPLPASLIFYPVISLMAEVLFHLLPLSLVLQVLPVLPVLPMMAGRRGTTAISSWAGLLLVALVEPTFQAAAAIAGTPVVGAPRPYDVWTVAYDSVHVLAINVCQLALFRRYDFVSMYAVRLVYYVIWHIVWGHVRLDVLF